jgi:hypothetical protein
MLLGLSGVPTPRNDTKKQNEVQLRDASLRKETATGSSNKTYFNSLMSSGLAEDGVSSQLEVDRRSKFVVV